MDINSVINLGNTRKQPLIGPSSELVDRLEPTASLDQPDAASALAAWSGGEEVYPGWRGAGGYREG